MKFKLRFSHQVVRDIKNVLAITLEQFGRRQHERYKSLIREALSEIAAHPDGPRSRKRPEFHPEARTLHISRRSNRARHLFLYRINSAGYVEVGRLLHDAMDLPEHLPEGYEPEEP